MTSKTELFEKEEFTTIDLRSHRVRCAMGVNTVSITIKGAQRLTFNKELSQYIKEKGYTALELCASSLTGDLYIVVRKTTTKGVLLRYGNANRNVVCASTILVSTLAKYINAGSEKTARLQISNNLSRSDEQMTFRVLKDK